VQSCHITPTFQFRQAEIVFFKEEDARKALLLDGVRVQGCRLSVKPSPSSAAPLTSLNAQKPLNAQQLRSETLVQAKPPAGAKNNLHVSQLPKELDENQVRRAFANFGRISSFKLVSKENYSNNIAYVAYSNPLHAQRAFESVTQTSDEMRDVQVNWLVT